MKKRSAFLLALVMFLATGCGNGAEEIIPASEWEDEHPQVYETYLRNNEMVETTFGGSVPIDYLEKYPELKTFYEGYGFSIEYLRARGHTYALEDVIHTERPKAAASCFACKSPDYLKLVQEEGITAHSMTFEEATESMVNTISCYDCHENTPGVINVNRGHFFTGVENLGEEFEPEEMVCGQCHVEYYQDPETKVVTLPWHNGFGTDGMLEYFDEIGYSDWEHPSTGTQLLKVQHPEFETFQGSLHSGFGLTCIDCHMPSEEGPEGDTFRSHHWTSPLKTVEASCIGCHSDQTPESLISWVEDIQGNVEERMNESSEVLLELIALLTEETNNQTVSDEALQEARNYHRQAQFKWDFVFVENSEGYHNNRLALQLLDEAMELAQTGIDLLR